MNQKKVKAIRRAMRADIKKGSSERWIAHIQPFVNIRDEHMVRYKMQYIMAGARNLVKLAKKIYRVSGILPQENYNAKPN